ncbi:3853_t:CDS:2 [Ambispora gerdemannii]|uniref:3853_t:CDS:1 n=1 Tax=Ambispora gerdemannii TaxID=144530 RepID=A0A9N8WAE9_9GLOM|nr:3853_t:CDS:2 [Ambispora gerdemannii]
MSERNDPAFYIPNEIFAEIIRHIQESPTLFSCLFVSRDWCRITIPILWQNPFSLINKNKRCVNYLSTSGKIQNFLKICFSKLPTTESSRIPILGLDLLGKRPKYTFDYFSFIREITYLDVSVTIELAFHSKKLQDLIICIMMTHFCREAQKITNMIIPLFDSSIMPHAKIKEMFETSFQQHKQFNLLLIANYQENEDEYENRRNCKYFISRTCEILSYQQRLVELEIFGISDDLTVIIAGLCDLPSKSLVKLKFFDCAFDYEISYEIQKWKFLDDLEELRFHYCRIADDLFRPLDDDYLEYFMNNMTLVTDGKDDEMNTYEYEEDEDDELGDCFVFIGNNKSDDLDDLETVLEEYGYSLYALIGHSKGDHDSFVVRSNTRNHNKAARDRYGSDAMQDLETQGYSIGKPIKNIPESMSVLTIHGTNDEVIYVIDAASFANSISNHILKLINGANRQYPSHKDEPALKLLNIQKIFDWRSYSKRFKAVPEYAEDIKFMLLFRNQRIHTPVVPKGFVPSSLDLSYSRAINSSSTTAKFKSNITKTPVRSFPARQ